MLYSKLLHMQLLSIIFELTRNETLLRICGVLSRLTHYVPVLILKIIYNSLLLSHLNYGITAWGFNVGPRIKHCKKRQSD